jgi:protein transport protein SEC31
LWDLNNLSQPYSPSSTKSNKLEDITDLAWNRIVPHILATASNSGTTVVWDLKSRKEVLQLTAPGQRVGMSAIAWNPENVKKSRPGCSHVIGHPNRNRLR